MNSEQIKEFRTKFQRIVFIKSEIKTVAAHLTKLHTWDKNDSHKKAIEIDLTKLDEFKVTYKERLEGKTYEEWKNFSHLISQLNNKIQRSKNDATKSKWKNELEKLNPLN